MDVSSKSKLATEHRISDRSGASIVAGIRRAGPRLPRLVGVGLDFLAHECLAYRDDTAGRWCRAPGVLISAPTWSCRPDRRRRLRAPYRPLVFDTKGALRQHPDTGERSAERPICHLSHPTERRGTDLGVQRERADFAVCRLPARRLDGRSTKPRRGRRPGHLGAVSTTASDFHICDLARPAGASSLEVHF